MDLFLTNLGLTVWLIQVFEFDTSEYIDHFKAVRNTYKELYEKDKVHNL